MAVDLTSLLESGAILPVSSATSRKQTVTLLSDAMAAKTGLDARDILDAVMERERLGSTGVGDGVAIPHARLAGLEKPLGAFVRLKEPVDFEAIDNRPCDLIFMLLAPESAGADHLRALAQVARAFKQQSLRALLRKTESEEGIKAILCRQEATNAA